jgi:hypothetical protein
MSTIYYKHILNGLFQWKYINIHAFNLFEFFSVRAEAWIFWGLNLFHRPQFAFHAAFESTLVNKPRKLTGWFKDGGHTGKLESTTISLNSQITAKFLSHSLQFSETSVLLIMRAAAAAAMQCMYIWPACSSHGRDSWRGRWLMLFWYSNRVRSSVLSTRSWVLHAAKELTKPAQ